MKELLIEHVPATHEQAACVRAGYRANERTQFQWRESDFAFEFSGEDRELIRWYLEEYLQCPWGAFKDRAARAEAALERVGIELFRAVFSSEETRGQYYRVADELAQTRIVIHAADPQGVALPWELLRDPQKPHGDLARQAAAFVRGQPDLAYEPPAPPEGDTFNILIVISRPAGEGDVPFQSVARPLLELCRPFPDRIHIDVLRPPTFEQLQEQLSDKPDFYHVLHFDGHGAFPQGGAGQGVLAFEGENEPSRLVTGEDLGELLAGRGVPLVVLNACQSGMTQTETIYASVGNQLLQAGVGGVVAMAYSVYVQSAVRFVARFYERLMAGDDAARAVHAGRESLRAHPGRISPIGELPLRDWMVPVFFESVAQPLVTEPLSGVRLNLAAQHDQQATAGAEIGCPAPPAFGFVGRDDAILRLERAFQQETIVLLEGMAGVGKTETAAGFARWRAETGALGGPVFFFSFEHYAPLARVCDEIGNVFQPLVKQQLGREWALFDIQQRRDLAVQLLRQVPCFLIWDNFEPVHGFPAGAASDWTADEQNELRDFLGDLRGGATKVLLTSRRDEPWLGPLYRRVPLGGLKLSEAQELAVRVLERGGLNAGQIKALPDYNALLQFLRGNPLAIQSILPELARRQPSALLADLQSGEAHLPRDDTQGRDRSLWASLNYRLDQLDATVRQRLDVLGLFQGFVYIEVLQRLCSMDDAPDFLQNLSLNDWVETLGRAKELGLLHDLGGYGYSIHPAATWFFHSSRDSARNEIRIWLQQAFIETYAAASHELGTLAESDSYLAVGLLSLEEANIMNALRLSRENKRWHEVAGILDGLQVLLTLQGRWTEWEKLLNNLDIELNLAEESDVKQALQITILAYRSGLAKHRNDTEQAKSIGLQLVDYYRRTDNTRNLTTALYSLGQCAFRQRNFKEAEDYYLQSLELSIRIGNKYQQTVVCGALGNLAKEQGRIEDAKLRYLECLQISGATSDSCSGVAGALYQLGVIALEQDDLEQAEHYFSDSQKVTNNSGERRRLPLCLIGLGSVAQRRNQLSVAEHYYRQALSSLDELGADDLRANVYHHLSSIAYEKHSWNEAEQWSLRGLALAREYRDADLQAAIIHNLVNIYLRQGDHAKALQCAREAETRFAVLKDSANSAVAQKSHRRAYAESVWDQFMRDREFQTHSLESPLRELLYQVASDSGLQSPESHKFITGLDAVAMWVCYALWRWAKIQLDAGDEAAKLDAARQQVQLMNELVADGWTREQAQAMVPSLLDGIKARQDDPAFKAALEKALAWVKP